MSVNNTSNNEDKLIVLCPTCKQTIPFIKIVKEERIFNLYIKCECKNEVVIMELNKYLHNLIDLNKPEEHNCTMTRSHHMCHANKYCTICQHWMCEDCLVNHNKMKPHHLLLNRELNLSCRKHYNTLNKYCNDCNKSICNECNVEHANHTCIQFNRNYLNEFIKESEFIEAIMNANKRYNHIFDEWIEQSSNLNEDWRSVINKAYRSNYLINLQLKELCLVMKQTADIIRDYANYSFIQSITLLKANNSVKLQIEITEFDKSYNLLKKHFNENYVLLIENKTTNTSQISKPSYQCIKEVEINDSLAKLIQLEDGRLVSISQDKIIKVWSSCTFQCLTSIKTHFNNLNLLIQLQDGRLVSSGNDGKNKNKNKIKLWDIVTFKCLISFKASKSRIFSIIQLKDSRLVSGGWDQKIRVWSTSSFQRLESFKGHHGYVIYLIQLNDGRLVSFGWDGIIKVWDVTTFECLKSCVTTCNDVNKVIQLQDGRLVSESNHSIKVWSIDTLQCLTSINVHNNCVTLLNKLNNDIIVSSGKDKMIILWSVPLLKCLKILQTHFDEVCAVIQLKDGRLLSLSSFDINNNCIQIWDV